MSESITIARKSASLGLSAAWEIAALMQAVIQHGGQLTGDDVLRRDVGDVDDLDHFEELLRHLVDVMLGAVDGEGHARQSRYLRVADRQRLDVKATLAPLRGDAVEHAGLVFD